MKKIIVSIIICLTVLSVSGQQNNRKKFFEFGPKIGVAAIGQNVTTNIVELNSLFNGFNLGFQAGAYARGMLHYKNVMFSLQLETLFTFDYYIGKDAHATATSFNFPLTIGLGYQFKNGLRIRGSWGPIVNVSTHQSVKTTYMGADYIEGLEGLLKRETWGHVSDLGVDYGRYAIDLRYTNQFKSVNKPLVVESMRYISWALTVAYRF